ncbi:hypothetical protein [Kribbella turkmenica]|nr:hypothetical protein [Kribbella turkmenica]
MLAVEQADQQLGGLLRLVLEMYSAELRALLAAATAIVANACSSADVVPR